MGIPWAGSMGNALGVHGLALGLVIGNSMGVLYGYAIVMSTGDSYGLAWLMLHRSTMDVPSVKYIGIPPPCGFYGIGWGWFIGEFHGMTLWAMHWDTMDLHWGLLIENSMEVLYG